MIKLAKTEVMQFNESEIMDLLESSEKNVFDDFFKKTEELKLIEYDGSENSDEYCFANRLYFAFFSIKSIESELILA